MKSVETLDLSLFLKDGSSNLILIHFNEEQFIKTTSGQLQFKDFKGKWLICEYEKQEGASLTGNLLYCDPDHFVLNQKSFPLVNYYSKLMDMYNLWNQTYEDLDFPDIVIASDKSLNNSACLITYEGNRHTLHLTLSDLSSVERFQYVIGHELGHLVYKSKYKDFHKQQINQRRYTSLFPWEGFVIALLNSYAGFSILTLPNLPFLGGVFCLTSILFWWWFFLFNLISFPRLLNYHMEFFCDYFSFYFFGRVDLYHLSDLYQNEINGYSHPSGAWRRYGLKNFTNFDPLHWQSPVVVKSFYFRTANFYELRFSTFLVVESIKMKFKKIFNT